ncbi:MAG: hypothetical protein EOP32_32480 [Rhodococcus sp. (in: high G+C Gram-positive bacteria)]|nr:MAG: hypothetical protein EOP32_32480 [Rhodococcus sp. (in: high G+C Gram-positive bacteria)]
MDSAYSKLSRAQGHLVALRSDIHAYRNRDPINFTYRQRNDPLNGANIIVEYIAKVDEEPPASWGLMVGDILTNLRAALDHALFGHIASRYTLTDDEAQGIQFPVREESGKWERWANRHSKWVEPSVSDAIGAMQPFNSVDPTDHLLWVLNRLVNYDKHRTLHVVAYRGEATFDKHSASIRGLSSRSRQLTHNAVIATMTVLRPLPAPGQRPEVSRLMFEGEAGFSEHIDIPGRGPTRLGVLRLMEVLTEGVEEMLADLRSAGC